MKKNLLKYFVCALATILTAILTPRELIQKLELKTFDVRCQLQQFFFPRVSNKKVVLIHTDWQQNRKNLAALIDKIDAQNPKMIVLPLALNQPYNTDALKEIQQLQQTFQQSLKKKSRKNKLFEQELSSAAIRLNADVVLARSIEKSGKVLGSLASGEIEKGTLYTNSVKLPLNVFLKPVTEVSSAPFLNPSTTSLSDFNPNKFKQTPSLSDYSFLSLAHNRVKADRDGQFRQDIPFIKNQQNWLSIALEVFRIYNRVPEQNVLILSQKHIQLGKIIIPLTSENTVVFARLNKKEIQHYSAAKIDDLNLENKIVVLAPNKASEGLAENFAFTAQTQSLAQSADLGYFYAWTIQNYIDKNWFVQPAWAKDTRLAIILLWGTFIFLFVPYLKPRWALSSILGLGILSCSGLSITFILQRVWLPMAEMLILFVLSLILLVVIGNKTFQKKDEKSEELNKLLALSFYNQGHYLQAFQRFNQCSLTPEIEKILFDIAEKLDATNALKVYEYLKKQKSKNSLIETKIKSLKNEPEKKEPEIKPLAKTTKPNIDGYSIEQEITQTGQGAIYRVRDAKNQEFILQTFWIDDFESNVLEENLNKLQNLKDSRIKQIHHYGKTEEVFYIIEKFR